MSEIQIWHKRLGHSGGQKLISLKDMEMKINLTTPNLKVFSICEVCLHHK